MLLMLTNCVSTKAPIEKNTNTSIFRYAHINISDSLIIGNSISPLIVYGEKQSEFSHRIPISHPGTESITAYFDKDSVITDLVFTYQSAYNFQESLSEYISDFGNPKETYFENYSVLSWSDGLTTFDLVRSFDNPEDTLCYSVLSDYKKSAYRKDNYGTLKTHRGSHGIHDVISTTQLWGFIENINEDIKSELSGEIKSADSTKIYSLIDTHFSSKALYQIAFDYMSREIGTESLLQLNEWLFSKWAIEQDYIIKKYEPESSIEEYAENLQTETPPRERIFTMLEFVQANKAGEFFLNIEDAQERLISELLSLTSNSDNSFSPLKGKERESVIEQYNYGILVSFLWAMEPLSNEQILKSTDAYNSESGKLYVDSYSQAIVHLYEVAGRNLLNDIKSLN